METRDCASTLRCILLGRFAFNYKWWTPALRVFRLHRRDIEIVFYTTDILYPSRREKATRVRPLRVFLLTEVQPLAYLVLYESDIFSRIIAFLFAVKQGCLSRGTGN